MTSIIFTGDIGFDKYMDGKWNDEDFLDEKIGSFLSDADHLCVNVEGPLCPPIEKVGKDSVSRLLHSMNPDAVKFLDDIGADIWNLCNNHIMDAGSEGIENTLKLCKEHEAVALGAGMNIDEASKPVILNESGGIGLIGVGYQRACRKADENTPGCFSWSDLDLIRDRIRQIKEKCRWCIVVAHAGEEFTSLPTPYTRERYLKYLEMGADIVICHHPHVPMNYELVGDKAIFYSLGNFVFDTDYQRAQFYTERGVFVKLMFSEESYSFEAFGILIDRNTQRIVPYELPDIFTPVNEEEYKKLVPLSAKAFLEATKRQLKYLYPDKFADADENRFMENFMEIPRSGRVPNETLDFHVIVPLAQSVSESDIESSKLQDVVKYIKKMMD